MRKVDFLEKINDSWCEKMGVSIVKKMPPLLFGENKIDENRRNESCMVFPSSHNILPFCICLLDFNSVNEVEDYIDITKMIKSCEK